MLKKLVRRLVTPLLAIALSFVFAGTATAVAPDYASAAATVASDPGNGFRTGDLTDAGPPPQGDAKKPKAAWSYHITGSCSGVEAGIRQGANFWEGATETPGSGTPVECTGGYIQCGDVSNAVGCNWGSGQRIMVSTMVSDFALLNAHEFGHNWYGHSDPGCANWASAYEVMRPTMC